MSKTQRYLPVMLLCALAAGVAATILPRARGALSCNSSGYRVDTYLAVCNNEHFGDYEHGAILFGLEPKALDHIHNADVLFLGSSRAQFAFSTDAVRRYFSAHGLDRYLLGFGFGELSDFTLAVMGRARPTAKVLVINADPFFLGGTSPTGQAVLDGTLSVRADYLMKKAFQPAHKFLCGALPKLCSPPTAAVFRSVTTGEWRWEGSLADPDIAIPIDLAKQVQFAPHLSEQARAAARAFVAKVDVDPACVILTEVPTGNQRAGTLPADVAEAIGARLITPIVGSLATIDGVHLNRESAERWSAAFLQAADATIRSCTRSRTEHAAAAPGTN